MKPIYICRTGGSTVARTLVANLQVSENGARHCLWRQPAPLRILHLNANIITWGQAHTIDDQTLETVTARHHPACQHMRCVHEMMR